MSRYIFPNYADPDLLLKLETTPVLVKGGAVLPNTYGFTDLS